MDFEAWIFALHVLSAALLVGSLVMSWIVIVSLRSASTAATTLSLNRIAIVGNAATIVGLLGAIGFGLWLAILRIDFHPWDAWVIAAIVLWAIATVMLFLSFVEYRKPVEKAKALAAAGDTKPNVTLTALNRSSTMLLLRALASTAVVLIVIDMLWKPGA